MKTVLLSLGTVAMFMYLSGCAPQAFVYRVDPISSDTVWKSGEEFQTATKDSLSVSVAFEEELGGNMTFYLVVGNMGADTMLVVPEELYYCGTHPQYVWKNPSAEESFIGSDSPNISDTIHAVNPEGQILSIDRQMEQANAAYAANEGVNSAARIMQVVGDVAAIAKDKNETNVRQEDRANQSLNKSEAENEANYNATMKQLSDEKDYWQNATLRKTTLFPNTAVAGKVSFPLDRNLQSLKFIVPIDTTIFEFDFKQTAEGQ